MSDPSSGATPDQRQLSPLRVVSTSRAADGGYRALSDVVGIASTIGAEYRIVGGHMVTLLVAAYGVSGMVPTRETLDVDFGALPHVVADPPIAVGVA